MVLVYNGSVVQYVVHVLRKQCGCDMICYIHMYNGMTLLFVFMENVEHLMVMQSCCSCNGNAVLLCISC